MRTSGAIGEGMRVYVEGVRGERDYRSYVDECSDNRCADALTQHAIERRAELTDTQDDWLLRAALTALNG